MTPAAHERPHHRRAELVAAVAAGGAVGTLGRYGLGRWLAPWHGVPVGTLTANLLGAFLLGLLLERLILAGPETTRRRLIRLGVGTGVLGGFTTYSSFALETYDRIADSEAGLAAGYALGSLVLGTALCWAGVLLAASWHARRRPPDTSAPHGDGPPIALLPADPDVEDVTPSTSPSTSPSVSSAPPPPRPGGQR